ncbi:protein NRT1/ PTR FAMILY 2.8-like [Primulina eburnea]|uniref:protein NRT1/ PTR FAMILY 2.8-like n=1 Tax=Primulina eburnea TaxID=1245227 RepID=UPI003C6BF8BA
MEIGSHSPSTRKTLSSSSQSLSKKPGGWRAIKYILGNESFEKLASISLVANITLYLRTKYNLSGIFLINTVTIWSGSTNLSSIAGAVVSDVYLGRFLTLLFGTIFTLLGMGAITLTAGIPELRPPPCVVGEYSKCIEPEKWQLAFLFTGLGLVALGAGGIRPCNIAFGADQFDTKTDKGRAQLESFFNWWYFSFTIALIIALTGVIYVQTNISWMIGYAIPTACLAISITTFLIGMHTYIYKTPQGTVFVDMAKVMAAAYRKRKIDLKSGDGIVFYNGVSEAESKSRKTIKADRFKFLDKAAVMTDPSEVDAQNMPKNGWKLCSVQQVENLKCLFGIGPVWISGVGCFVVMDQQSTFGILQSIQMNRMLGKSFTIPPAWMGISSMIALSIWIFVYEQIYVKKFKKILKKADLRMTMQQRITTGIIMSILCMVVAGIVEIKRKELALRHNTLDSPLHVTALLPQFILSGLTEAFAAVAIMEFFTIQMPETMRSVAGSVFFLSLSIASYLSSFLVNVVHSVTKGRGDRAWLGGNDLNKNKLEYYYYFIASLGVLNLFYFTFFARKFVLCEEGGKDAACEGPGEDSGVHRAGVFLGYELDDLERKSSSNRT